MKKKVRVLRTFGLPGQGFFAEGSEIAMEVAERCEVPYVPIWRYEQLQRAGLIEEPVTKNHGIAENAEGGNGGEIQS